MKNRIFLAALLIVSLFPISFLYQAQAQESDSTQPDKWHGLALDQTTPEEAIKLLGQPAKDKLNKLDTMPIEQWVTKKRKEKIFRTLEYKKPTDAVEKAWLAFLDDKLVSILLDMKEGTVSPNALSRIYGVEFRPVINQMDLGLFPKDFEQHAGEINPKSYPTVYHLAAVSEKSFVTAMIGNVPSFAGALGKSMGVPDKPGSFPGKVSFVQLISRTLENRDGAEALK